MKYIIITLILFFNFCTIQPKPLKVAYFFGIFDDDWDKRLNKNVPFDKADLIYIAFAHSYDEDQDGAFELGYENAHKEAPYTDQERIDQIVQQAKAKNPNIKILISLGWNRQDYWKSSRNPEIFAQSVLKMMRNHQLDGFDMDYEIDGDPITKEDFIVLSKTLRQYFDQATIEDKRESNPYLLTITPDHTSFAAWDGKIANEVFDYINLQTYWGNRFKFIDQFKQTGVNPRKMFLGFSSESYNRPADQPDIYINKAREINAQGVFAWRLDTDSIDRLGTTHYSIAHKTWELAGREINQ